jgi:hypothetical protein
MLAVLASLLADALYQACQYAYQRGMHVSVYLKVLERWRRIVEWAQLLASFLIRVTRNAKRRIHASVLAAILLILLEAESCLLLLGNWRSMAVTSYSKFRNSVNANLASLAHPQTVPRLNPFSRPMPAAIATAGMIAFMITLVFLWMSHETMSPLPSKPGIAGRTNPQFGDSTDKDGKGLVVSYWVGDSDRIYQINTTGDSPRYLAFPADQSTIIGCGFAHPNHSVRWDGKSNHIVVSSFSGEPSPIDDRCEFKEFVERKLSSIVCDSYNPTTSPENTVGVCVSTESEQDIFSGDALDSVRRQAEDLYKNISPSLEFPPAHND